MVSKLIIIISEYSDLKLLINVSRVERWREFGLGHPKTLRGARWNTVNYNFPSCVLFIILLNVLRRSSVCMLCKYIFWAEEMKTNLVNPCYSLYKIRCFIINLCRTLRQGQTTLFESALAKPGFTVLVYLT